MCTTGMSNYFFPSELELEKVRIYQFFDNKGKKTISLRKSPDISQGVIKFFKTWLMNFLQLFPYLTRDALFG